MSTTKKEHFTKTLTAASDCVSSNDETPPPKPVVLPLLQKLYLKQNKENFHNKESQTTSTEDCTMNKAKGIMRQKVETYIQQSTDSKPEEFLKTLQFTDAEINHVEEATRDNGNVKTGTRTKLVLYQLRSAKMFAQGKQHWKRQMNVVLLFLPMLLQLNLKEW